MDFWKGLKNGQPPWCHLLVARKLFWRVISKNSSQETFMETTNSFETPNDVYENYFQKIENI